MGARARHDYSDGRYREETPMNIFYIIGVVVVVLAIFGYLRIG